jgi:hypothetical protein
MIALAGWVFLIIIIAIVVLAVIGLRSVMSRR